jgi:hypothetical protein
MGDEIAAFLAARLDETEAAAKAATGSLSGRWHTDVDGNVQDEDTGGGGNAYIAVGPYGCSVDDADAAHILRHDPARVLRDVQADRAILAMYEDRDGYDLPEGVQEGRDPDERACDEAIRDVLRDVLEIRAARFSDHPDYREEWRP